MSKYSMTKYLFLCNTSGTKPVLIFKGFRLDAHTEPMIPVMQYNIKSCKNQQRSTSSLPVVTLVTPDHGRAVVLLAAGGADPDLVAGLVRVAAHRLGDDPHRSLGVAVRPRPRLLHPHLLANLPRLLGAARPRGGRRLRRGCGAVAAEPL